MPIIFQDYTMELSIIQDKKDFPSMTATDITVAICGAVLLTFMHMSLFKSDESIDDTTPDTDSNVITTTTTTTTTVTEAVITTTKRHRPKVAHQMVEEVVEPEIEPDVDVDVDVEVEDPEVPNKSKNYLSTLLKDNEDIAIIIHLLDKKTMKCNAKYTNERIKITQCDYIPSLIGCPFHTPIKLQYRILALLQKTKYKPNPKQNIWAQIYVERDNKMVSLSSLK